MRFSMHEGHQAKLLTAPDQQTAAFNSLHLDLRHAEAGEIIACLGDCANTLGASPEVSWDVIAQHADDDGSGTPTGWAAITTASDLDVGANGNVAAPDSSGVIATLDNDGDQDKLLRVGYVGDKPHFRLRFVANNSPGASDWTVIGLKIPSLLPAADVASEINL